MVAKLNRNGGQQSELDETEWLHPPGAPSSERYFIEMKTGFLILTGSSRIVRKIKTKSKQEFKTR